MIRSGTAETPRSPAGGRLTEDELLSALPARSAHREVRVGLFVLVGLLAFLVALFTLTDVGTFRGRYYATTVVADAGGMRRGDPVQMRGVNIGRVIGFQMVPDGVAVRLELYNRFPVPADSRAVVRSSGLLGGMVVDVMPGNSEERVEDDEMIPGMVEEGILATATGVGTRADTVLDRVTALLSERTIGAVGESAVQLQGVLGELNLLAAEQRRELAAVATSLRRSAAGVERATAGPELERAVARIDSLTLRLDETTRSLGRASGALELVLTRMERGEGTLGKLSADDSLYVSLNTAAVSLNELIEDIRREPRKYFSVRVF